MPKMTISEAARIAGVPRSTIYRKIKTGEMSCETLDGRKVVDPSELQRVFPSDRPIMKHATSKDSTTHQFEKEDVSPSFVQQVEMLQNHIATLQDTNKMLQKDKDRLLTLLETKMLTDQREQVQEPPEPKSAPSPKDPKPKKQKDKGKNSKKGKKK